MLGLNTPLVYALDNTVRHVECNEFSSLEDYMCGKTKNGSALDVVRVPNSHCSIGTVSYIVSGVWFIIYLTVLPKLHSAVGFSN